MLKQIETEGVQVEIEWGKFIVGSSFFLPCIDTGAFRRQMEKHAEARGVEIKMRDRMENLYWGVRVWRVA
mgnify:CR=1 FL=1|jgi:hypothetical protein